MAMSKHISRRKVSIVETVTSAGLEVLQAGGASSQSRDQ